MSKEASGTSLDLGVFGVGGGVPGTLHGSNIILSVFAGCCGVRLRANSSGCWRKASSNLTLSITAAVGDVGASRGLTSNCGARFETARVKTGA